MRFLSGLKRENIVNKVCLLRVDFNVESATDALRLKESLPTIKFLLKNNAKIVLLSHRGRPQSLPQKQRGKLSLKFILPFLKKNLPVRTGKEKIVFLRNIPAKLPSNRFYLLENLRFWKGEEQNNLTFAKQLASLGDFYVNDSFSASHRKHASIVKLPELLPAYAGFLLEKELKTLSKVIKKPKKPLVVIFGGKKVADKIPAIKKLLPKADIVLLGSSFIKFAKSFPMSEKINKPLDWLTDSKNFILDIGPLTAKKYILAIQRAKTIIWNGPLGKFENKRFARGSIAIAKAIAKSKAFSVVGGGETTQLILQLKLQGKISFLSTGGGAMLEFLAGKKLPGVAALRDNH